MKIEKSPEWDRQKLAIIERIHNKVGRYTIPIAHAAFFISTVFSIYLFDFRTESISLFPQQSLEILTPIFFVLFLITGIAGLLAATIERLFQKIIDEASK